MRGGGINTGAGQGQEGTAACILPLTSDVEDRLCSSQTTPLSPPVGVLSTAPPHCPPGELPLIRLGLAYTTPLTPAFLGPSLLSELVLPPNVLIYKFHRIQNSVLLQGFLSESSRSRGTELALRDAE